METHVLIPRELTLKVRPNTQSPSIAKLLEPRVSIISTVELPKGLKIHPAQGTVRCGKLELYSMFGQKDVSLFINSPKPWRVLETTFLLLSSFFLLPFAY